jgi:hypothetical protein
LNSAPNDAINARFMSSVTPFTIAKFFAYPLTNIFVKLANSASK